MQLLQPQNTQSEYEALWLTLIVERLDEGRRIAYSNGSGKNDHVDNATDKTAGEVRKLPVEGTSA